NYLYVAATTGLGQYDLLNPNAPVKTQATFALSGTAATSLALAGNTLYVTDGDPSVEVFSISVPTAPARLGAVTSLLGRPTAVNAGNGRVYVSDGQQTDIFVGTDANLTRAGNAAFPIGTTSFAPLSPTAIFTAGS